MAKWIPKHKAPEPLEGPIVPTIIGGTILWLVLFVVQLPFYGWYEDHGHEWWVWTCLAGGGLGFIGIYYVRRRDAAIKRDAARQAAADAETGTDAGTETDTEAGTKNNPETKTETGTEAEAETGAEAVPKPLPKPTRLM
jgi:hypothetical protein